VAAAGDDVERLSVTGPGYSCGMPGKPDEARRERARNLRREGYSLSQIARIMGLKSTGGSLGRWLQGVPAPHWTRRPRAKDGTREKAVRLRREGRSYREIEEILGVSRSSVSLWVRNVPLTEEHRAALAERRRAAYERQAASVRAASRARHQRLIDEAASQVGTISNRELFVAGVVAYWAEGSKTKPWGRRSMAKFINSDPGMIRLILGWLRLLGVTLDDLTFRVQIHESADVAVAERFWSRVVDVPASRFLRATLKRHKPRTVRKNVGDSYAGCLIIYVRRSTDLNSRIAGWFKGIEGALPDPHAVDDGDVRPAGA
jgi:transcriptional regulator with XRE-family HTH domain